MVRVVSCRYMRISCSEDDHPLFRRYYARSNRERGVKLLRCFPHCCPEHVQRCYCGSSIHVLVTFAAEVPAASQRNLIVCARFEPSKVVPLWPSNLSVQFHEDTTDDGDLRKMQPGEMVSLPMSLSSTGKRQPPTIWIRADREGEVKQTYQNAVLFVLNNHRFPKWLYSYDSSITRTQREMTHHLVVYVCQLTGTSSQPSEIDATVLARHESPGFSLISFRRSGQNGSHAGCDLPAIDVNSSATFAAVEVDSPDPFFSTSDNMEIDPVGQPALSIQNVHELESKRPHASGPQQCSKHQIQHEAKCRAETRQPQLAASSSGFPQATQDKFSWQQGPIARSCGFREKAKHLLILWRFFRTIAVCDLGLWSDAAGAHVRSHWLWAAGCLREPSLNASQLTNVVESFLAQAFTTTPPKSSRAKPPTARESAIIRVTVHLFLRGLLSDVVQDRIMSTCSMQNDTSSKSHLQDNFALLVSDLYDTFGGVLRQVSAQLEYLPPGSQNASLPALVDDALSLVCSHELFRELQPDVITLLLDKRPTGPLSDALGDVFQAYTAVVREAMIIAATRYRHAKRQRCCVPLDENLLWNQRWLLEPGSLQFIDTSTNRRNVLFEMGLAEIAQLVYEFGCLDITVEDNGFSLAVKSPLSLFGGTTTAPMTLVLDGKLRLFRVMPSGMPSMIQTAGGWSVGDYKAILSEDRRLLTVDLFSFAESAESGIIRLRWVNLSIRVVVELSASDATDSDESKHLLVFVHGTVYGSTLPASELATGFKLSEMQTSDRAATWSRAEWTPLCEGEVDYIALPVAEFV